MMSASPERADPSQPHHHHASPSKKQEPPLDKRKKSNFEDCRDFVSAERQNEKRSVNSSTREFLQELDDLKRGVPERDSPVSRQKQRREARPRSVCERDSRASVFCFEGSSLAADGRSLAADGGDERVTMRERDKDEEGRLYQGAGIKVPSNRMSTGLQVSLAQPAAVSVATSTPIATSYTSGNDAHWSAPQPGAPHSPGALSWHGEAPTSSDKSSETGTGAAPPPRLSRKESYKAQRQNYRREKKKAASALLSTLEDPAVLILADWLKVRGSLKSWTKLWCVLKPGLLLLYKSPKAKSNHWVGTVLLSACRVIERPSKKDGFCFKLYNPLEQSIWAPRGPHNETIGAVVQPLPTAHLIFRAPSQAAGKCWLDGLELALRCSNTLLRTGAGETKTVDATANHETQWSPEDLERHFNEQVVKLTRIIREHDIDHFAPVFAEDNASILVNVGDCPASERGDESTNAEIDLNNLVVRWSHIVARFCAESDFGADGTEPFSGDELSSGEMDPHGEGVWARGSPGGRSLEGAVEKKRDSVFGLDFFKKNAFCTASLRTKMFKDRNPCKHLSVTPSRQLKGKDENPRDKLALLGLKSDGDTRDKLKRSFSDPHDKPSFVLSAAESEKKLDDSQLEIHESHNIFEESLLKIVSAFPKRRSSTPSAFFKIGSGDDTTKARTLFSKYRNDVNGSKFDPSNRSCNEISITTDDVSKRSYRHLNISGRKSADPRMVASPADDNLTGRNLFSSLKFDDGQMTPSARHDSDISRDPTPERFSLIRYERLPSVALEGRQERDSSERHSRQGFYVSGQIVKETELEGAGLSESDSEEKAEDQPGGELPEEGGVLAILKNVYADEASDHVPQSGEVVEELGEENKSLLWFLIKQVRPGMDLSKVVLPTFILEPRSFLDKLSDSFYHSDILARACRQSDPYERMKTVLTWYLSGLYRKPRGLKKPYNPVLGETFRCCWLHPDSDTRTYYVSEQVSHHPPVSAFYVSNRKEGFAIEATILAKSKFYGNSTSAILEGLARVALLPLAETYLCTSPYAHCKGLLLGTLSMELGGRVTIHCPATDYTADVDFKLKPFIGGSDSINMVSGRIRHFKETVATIEGHWDGRIDIRDKKTQEECLLMDAAELKTRRLRRQLVVADRQAEFESQRLWRKVSEAIAKEDQIAATEQKTCIEEGQRERARDSAGREWQPRYFSKALYTDGLTIPQSHGAEANHTSYQYNYHNFTPWDESVDVLEYEEDFVIKTLRRQAHALPSRTSLQARTQPETEHSASETDSTNSHHNTRTSSQSQQSVAAALLRMEAALREQRDALVSVSAAVKRLEAPARASQGAPCTALAVSALLVAILGQALALYYYSR